MHAIEIILRDHATARDLFERLDNTTLGKPDQRTITTRRKLFEELRSELLRHEKMEQDFFYPFIKKHDPFHDQIKHLIQEENDISNLLSKFNNVGYDSKEWLTKYHKLKSVFEHHTCEEETKLFPTVIELIPKKLLEAIGTEMNEFRKRAERIRVQYYH